MSNFSCVLDISVLGLVAQGLFPAVLKNVSRHSAFPAMQPVCSSKILQMEHEGFGIQHSAEIALPAPLIGAGPYL